MNQASATLLLSKVGPGGAGAEGLGLVLLEAQARGCPVISSGTGGLAEATEQGLILADSDTPDLDRVRSFLGDLGAGERARKWVRARHSPNLCAQVLLEALS
jgi:glycosyltransferase involved in cell wall biosynthesis